MRKIGGFLRVLQFPPPITDHYDTTEILLKVALNTIILTLLVCDDVKVSISYWHVLHYFFSLPWVWNHQIDLEIEKYIDIWNKQTKCIWKVHFDQYNFLLFLQIYRHNILINKNDIDWSYRYITTIIEEVSGSSGTNLQALRTFRVFRALKTISIIPGEFI